MFLRSLLLLVASFYGTLTLVSSRSHYDDQKFKNAIQLKSRVGSHVAFVYNLEFPTDYPIPFHLTYTKDVSNFIGSIFIFVNDEKIKNVIN